MEPLVMVERCFTSDGALSHKRWSISERWSIVQQVVQSLTSGGASSDE